MLMTVTDGAEEKTLLFKKFQQTNHKLLNESNEKIC